MKRLWSGLAVFFVASGSASAEDTPGHAQILTLAGCHDVTYHFHEDGEHDYLNPEMPPAVVNREYTAATENGPRRIVLQHATIAEDGQAIPHWHEEWTYGEGGWTQSIYGRGTASPERGFAPAARRPGR
jgi:hypothetical protein